MSAAIEYLWSATCVLGLIWAIRIWRLHLVRRYPILFIYLISTAALDVLGNWFYISKIRVWGQEVYDLFWVTTTPLYWLLWFGLVFEVYAHMIERYAGVRKLGRIVFYATLVAGAGVVAALLFADPYRIPDLNRWKSMWLKQEQGMYLAIAGLVFVLLVFKRAFRLGVSRNVQLIFTTFGLYFAGTAAMMVLRTYMGPTFRSTRDLTVLVLYVACLAVGSILFSRAGEASVMDPALEGAQRPEMASRAAQQLRSFNDRLVRVLNA